MLFLSGVTLPEGPGASSSQRACGFPPLVLCSDEAHALQLVDGFGNLFFSFTLSSNYKLTRNCRNSLEGPAPPQPAPDAPASCQLEWSVKSSR